MTTILRRSFCRSSEILAVLLGMASQRVEYLFIELFGNEWMRKILAGWKKHERGSIPGFVETGVVIYVISNVKAMRIVRKEKERERVIYYI